MNRRKGCCCLVDEAQALAVHLLEELRLLTNLSRGGAPRVRLVMAGLPALEEKLASPELAVVQPAALRPLLPRSADARRNGSIRPGTTGRVDRRRRSAVRPDRVRRRCSTPPTACRGW